MKLTYKYNIFYLFAFKNIFFSQRLSFARPTSQKLILIYNFFSSIQQKKALGSYLYEQVLYSLDLTEKDYFGLQFTDHNQVKHWLDPTKPIKKQVKSMLTNFFSIKSANNLYLILLQLDHRTLLD